MEYVYYGWAAVLWCFALGVSGALLITALKCAAYGTRFLPSITINRKGPKYCPHCGRGVCTGRTKAEGEGK